jgi:hypothetical protein
LSFQLWKLELLGQPIQWSLDWNGWWLACTNSWIGLNWILSKLKMPTCLAHSTSLSSLELVHLWKNDLFHTRNSHHHFIFLLTIYFRCKLVTSQFQLYIFPPFHFLCHFLTNVSSHPHKNFGANFNNTIIMKKKEKLNEQCFLLYWSLGAYLLGVSCKNRFMGINEPFLSLWCHFVDLDEKNPTMITLMESVISNFVM